MKYFKVEYQSKETAYGAWLGRANNRADAVLKSKIPKRYIKLVSVLEHNPILLKTTTEEDGS